MSSSTNFIPCEEAMKKQSRWPLLVAVSSTVVLLAMLGLHLAGYAFVWRSLTVLLPSLGVGGLFLSIGFVVFEHIHKRSMSGPILALSVSTSALLWSIGLIMAVVLMFFDQDTPGRFHSPDSKQGLVLYSTPLTGVLTAYPTTNYMLYEYRSGVSYMGGPERIERIQVDWSHPHFAIISIFPYDDQPQASYGFYVPLP